MKLSFSNKLYLYLGLVTVCGMIGVLTVYFINEHNNNGAIKYGENFKVTYIEGTNIRNSYEQYMKNASVFWSNMLDEKQEIKIQVSTISDSWNVLAKGGPFSETNLKGGGVIYFNKNASAFNWTDVAKHEMGHVLGIGTNQKWKNAIITLGEDKYLNSAVFPRTYQVYVTEYNGQMGHIPLNRGGGHFSEEIFDTELMTPYSEALGVRQPATKLTLTALKELGWKINLDNSETKN